MHFDPSETYVHLAAGGGAQQLPGGEPFWALPETELDRFGQGWLITEFMCASDWPNWEMHPHGDEFVYLLSGDVALHLELPSGLTTTRIVGSGALVVPRGVWHTAKVFAPSRMFFVTRGQGTEHRPS